MCEWYVAFHLWWNACTILFNAWLSSARRSTCHENRYTFISSDYFDQTVAPITPSFAYILYIDVINGWEHTPQIWRRLLENCGRYSKFRGFTLKKKQKKKNLYVHFMHTQFFTITVTKWKILQLGTCHLANSWPEWLRTYPANLMKSWCKQITVIPYKQNIMPHSKAWVRKSDGPGLIWCNG